MRVCVNTRNIWMPRGGSEVGTVALQVTRVDPGVKVSDRVLSFFFQTFVGNMAGDLQKQAAQLSKPGSPWLARMERDSDGLYAELQQLEQIASQRRPVSTSNLPGIEVLER